MPLIDSSCFSAYEYDENERILTVTFRRTNEIRQYEVPKYVFRQFEASSSKGQFFNSSIKDVYPEA